MCRAWIQSSTQLIKSICGLSRPCLIESILYIASNVCVQFLSTSYTYRFTIKLELYWFDQAATNCPIRLVTRSGVWPVISSTLSVALVHDSTVVQQFHSRVSRVRMKGLEEQTVWCMKPIHLWLRNNYNNHTTHTPSVTAWQANGFYRWSICGSGCHQPNRILQHGKGMPSCVVELELELLILRAGVRWSNRQTQDHPV